MILFVFHSFSMKNTISDLMMGVETPIPPNTINSAAPEGTPPRRISDNKECPETYLAPPCLGEALRRVFLIQCR